MTFLPSQAENALQIVGIRYLGSREGLLPSALYRGLCVDEKGPKYTKIDPFLAARGAFFCSIFCLPWAENRPFTGGDLSKIDLNLYV